MEVNENETQTGEVERCTCGAVAEWTWFNGMGVMGRYCDDHARDELPDEASLPSYKNPITTKQNATMLRGRTVIIPGGGVKPLDSTYPVVRSKEAFDRYADAEAGE